MNNVNIIDKIYKIFLHYVENESKLWNIDTNFFNTWTRFINELKEEHFSFDTFKYSEIKIKIIDNSKKDLPNKFALFLNDANVTPRKNNKNFGWAKSSLRQFLQVGSAFDIFIFNHGDFFDNEIIPISPKMAQLLEKNFEWFNIIITVIKCSLFSNASHIKNLGFSIFFCYIMQNNIDLTNMKNPIEFKLVRIKKGNHPFFSNDLYCKEYAEKIYKETYKNIVDILKDEIHFEKFIDTIYNYLLKNNDISNEWQELEDSINYNNKKKEKIFLAKSILQSERGLLRQNIIKYRAKNKKEYCDLELDKNSFLVDHMDAAHIYEIKSISKEIIDLINKDVNISDEIICAHAQQASNFNNGLLMPKAVHSDFDKNIFQFDMNGKIIYQEENFNRIKELGLVDARIRKGVLNDKMLEFLKKRII